MRILRTDVVALLTILMLVLAAAPRAQAAAEGSFERTLQVTGPVDLEVTTGSGDLDVRAGAGNTVRVTGRIKVSRWSGDAEGKVKRIQANPPIQQNGNSIVIGRIEDPELKRNVSISYTIVVPAETRLNANTGSGNEKIEGIRGPVQARSGSGDLAVSDVAGGTDAQTGSGNMRLDHLNSGVRVRTGSGDIEAEEIAGAFEGEAGSGDVHLVDTASGDVRVGTGSGELSLRGVNGALDLHTGSGSVEVEGKPAGNWRLSAGSGDIRLNLPRDAGFELEATSHSGNVSVDRPLTVQGMLGQHSVHGTAGSGGNKIEVRTGSGEIEIR